VIRNILVPVDGSELAGRALAFAIDRAGAAAEITVAFVINRISVSIVTASPFANVDPAPLLAALDSEAEIVLQSAESLVAKSGITVKAAKLDGVPSSEILKFARQSSADLIVMGTHGRSGFDRFAVGSTAEDVIRAAGVPVFVVPQRGEAANAGKLRHGLVAVDGSPASEAALTFACGLALAEGAKLTLCTAIESDDLDRDVFFRSEAESNAKSVLEAEQSRALALGLVADTVALEGDADLEILASAEQCGADFIVVGTHGRAGIPRLLIGSVAEAVLRTSRLPVCTVRQTS